jgi:hypothetical protein
VAQVQVMSEAATTIINKGGGTDFDQWVNPEDDEIERRFRPVTAYIDKDETS